MRNINWKEVKAPGSSLPAGGYVIEILDVVDNEDWEQLNIVYNIVEGEFKDIYKNMGPDDDWKHQFSQKYTDNALGFFKRFLEEIEHDNPEFSVDTWDNDPLKLVGKKMGILLGEYRYIYDDKAKYRLQAVSPMPIEKIRQGDFSVPEPTYKRGTTEQEWAELREGVSNISTASSDILYDDIPFK